MAELEAWPGYITSIQEFDGVLGEKLLRTEKDTRARPKKNIPLTQHQLEVRPGLPTRGFFLRNAKASSPTEENKVRRRGRLWGRAYVTNGNEHDKYWYPRTLLMNK